MALVEPGIGLIFWTSAAFIILWVFLGKVAWKPILKAIKDRENSIAEALDSSKHAKSEVEKLKGEINDMKLLARNEREGILKEAKENASKIIAEAQEKAREEGNRLIVSAQEAIQNEKKAALAEVKDQVAKLSLEIAERVIRQQLATDSAQQALVNDMLKELKLN